MHHYFNLILKTKETILKIGSGELKHTIWIPYFINSFGISIPFMWDIGSSFDGGLITFILALILGTLFGFYILILVIPAIYYVIGKFFGGKASYEDTQLLLSLVFIPQILIVSNQLFRAALNSTFTLPEAHPIVDLIVSFFSLKILIVGLAYYNNFTFQKAFVCVLSSIIIPIVLYAMFKL